MTSDSDYPFTDPEFLTALEASGSVGAGSGWQPVPLPLTYVKMHSYGEYVFDWEWARFFQSQGASYYPKLVTAVPFTPATGPRLGEGREAHVQSALDLCRTARLSSWHLLFGTPDDLTACDAAGCARRFGWQYHWRNKGYRDFQDYTDALLGKRRRDVVRERRRAASHGLDLVDLTGAALTPAHAAAMERLYLLTAERKDAIPYLREGFFDRLFRSMPDRILMTAALRQGEVIAAALNLYKGKHLYGRYWGSVEELPDLHFELCYYRTIAFAIARGMTLFEAGAQGEHKLQRGFLPTITESAHYILSDALRPAISTFLAEERAAVTRHVQELMAKSPYSP